MYQLNTPKRLYLQWLAGAQMDPHTLATNIQDSMDRAEKLKATYQKQKIELSWQDYKKMIEEFLQKIFLRCKCIEDYEDNTRFANIYDFMNEDNFYIHYFCKSLEGEMLKWQKQYYGIREHKKYRRCADCHGLFELKTANQHRCPNCQKLFTRKSKTEKQRKYRLENIAGKYRVEKLKN